MARPLLAATTAFLLCSPCLADDTDPTIVPFVVEPSQTGSSSSESSAIHDAAPSRGLLSRWFGRSDAPASTIEMTAAPVVAGPATSTFGTRAGELVSNALGLIGVMYRRGGNNPESGFDCSGMVRYVFQNAAGLDLPRRAAEISRIGAKVDRDELQPGDLVFYNTLKKTFSHVGIYLGNNRFIHAPSRGSAVRIEDMTKGYWAARFDGARRVAQ